MAPPSFDSGAPAVSAPPVRDLDELCASFAAAVRPAAGWLIGAESERFGVDAATFAPIAFDGERGAVGVLAALRAEHGWQPYREHADGPVIALRRGAAAVTLEPGAQLELSGSPWPDVHAVAAEMDEHLGELRAVSAPLDLTWLAVGFHPLARQDELPWVPKRRYAIMREYLPPLGSGALDMMRRTASVQVNLDFSSEEDALEKLRLALRVAPLANAMTAHSPWYEGHPAGRRSLRGDVWLRMDPSRSGLIPRLWRDEPATFRDYVEWALDAGMFLFLRDGQVVANTGQTFRSFLADGFAGHRATLADWELHLHTLFPEARLRRTLEVRCCDALPPALAPAVPAFFTGLLYDPRALAAARDLMAPFSHDDVQRARPELVARGLGATIAGRSARRLAEDLLDLAWGGLARRARLDARGADETVHLRGLRDLVGSGRTPADVVTEGLGDGAPITPSELVARTRI